VVLYAPEQAGDSLVGYRQPGVAASRVALPMRHVLRIEVKRADDVRTSLLLGAVSVTAVVVLVGGAMAADRMAHSFSLP